MWNKAFEKIMKIKHEYVCTFGSEDLVLNIDYWVEKLNVDEYVRFLAPLQTTHYSGLLLVRYGIDDEARGLWVDKNSIYRQCRSLVVDLENEKIVLSPFRKFFNINEVEENKVEDVINAIEAAEIFEVADKMDGSMISARWYDGEVILSTSKSLDRKSSWRLDDAYRMAESNHKIVFMLMDHPNITFVFEYISLRDAHTVAYKKEDEGLYVIGAINVLTGHEWRYKDVLDVAKFYGVPSTAMEDISLEEMLRRMRTESGDKKEGWVINIDGHKIKIKCDDYVSLHRVISASTSINAIIKAIANGNLGDIKSKLSDGHRGIVEEKAKEIYLYMNSLNDEIEKVYKSRPSDDKKEFMIWVDSQDKYLQKYLRMKYLSQEYSTLKARDRYVSYREIKGYLDRNFTISPPI